MRHFFTRFFLIVACCTVFLAPQAQTKKYPSTLLWRITGKGLSKPSYLFGTMHVTDRRVFYFSDSLYKCLEKAEGYAMELDPDTAFTALFRSIFSADTSGLVKDAVDSKEFSHMAKRLEAELGIPAGKVTKKQLWLYSFKGGRDKKTDDMDSPVDTYLYNIAKRQGKWVGGIEDLEDQVNLLEELGSKFDADALLYKADSKNSVEKMTAFYRDQDLSSIEAWMSRTDTAFRNNLLDKRNIKMAHRMDSMAALRSLFFAVGAAHLPGEHGLITLLRAKGYTVEPVISGRKIAPEAYTYQTVALPWKGVDDEDKTYSVQMPGKPFPMKLPGGITMQCYADIGTGLIYFSMAVQYPAKIGNNDSILAAVGKNMAHTGQVEKQEYISYNGTRGVEILAAKANSYYYRVRTFLKGETMFMVMTGSEKKGLLQNAESERFFHSLVMHSTERAPVARSNQWLAFTEAGKGYSLDLPGKPEHNKQMEQLFKNKQAAYGWNFSCYSYSDLATGNYYLLSVKDTRNGYYLQNDTSAFSDARQNAVNAGAEIIVYDTITWHGYRALNMTALYAKTNLVMQSFTVCRGNRLYVLVGLYEKDKGDTADIGRFLHSFRLLGYPAGDWQQEQATDHSFSAWAPAAMSRVHTQNEDTTLATFSAYDSLHAVSYEVEKQPFPPYYWAASDSSFFASMLSSHFRRWDDSLLSKKEVQNGQVRGMEYIFRTAASSNLKRVRMLPGADSIYVLFSYLSPELVNDENATRFFTSFRLTHESANKPWLENKTKALMTALQSTDSATAAEAQQALNNAPFTKEDLPLLHQALLHTYRGADSMEIYNSLTESIAALKDSSTLTFIREQYPLLKGEKEALKCGLLSVLAHIETAPSYALFKNLLLQQAPKAGDLDDAKYTLADSLALTATLFPDLLPLSKDSLFIKIMPYLLMKLADSNLVRPAQLLPYKNDYIAFARKEYRRVKNNDWTYEADPLVRLLGWLNDADANAALQPFLLVKSMELKETAALALIKNNRPVNPALVTKLAADKSLRTGFYQELVKCKKENLFPTAYHTQKSFAEAELYETAINDYDSIGMYFIGTRSASWLGKTKTFYLFKINFPGEEETTSHLGIAGPYTAGSSKLLMESDAVSVFWEEEYDVAKTTTQFNKLVSRAEKGMKEDTVSPVR